MSNQSTSELFIEAMIRLRELDKFTSNDEAMRHQVRTIKQAAERGIDDACRQAISLAYCARDLSKEVKDVVKEAVAAATTNERTP